MKSLKVMTIVGTRPEIIKLSRVIAELDKYTNHVLVHTGQNYDYELNEVFFKELGLRSPDHVLGVVGNTLAETMGNILAKSDAILEKEKPDAVLLYGDTNSCLSVISAKRRKIPIFHMEAGNRCFDQRVPEEINRKIVDHLSDINLPLTEHARRYLLDEGIKPETIIKVGSSMHEVLTHYKPQIESSQALKTLGLKAGGFILVSAHREENVDQPARLTLFLEALNTLAKHFDKKIIVSTHPRTKNRIEALETKQTPDARISFLKPMGFFDYIKLQQEAFCVVSDSGTITEESSLLGFPAITIREAHERPEGMDEGTIIMADLGSAEILAAVHTVTEQFKHGGRRSHPVSDYMADSLSEKIVRIILSYTGYVNRTVWRKP